MVDFAQMKNQLLKEQGGDDEDVAADRTGFAPRPASRYETWGEIPSRPTPRPASRYETWGEIPSRPTPRPASRYNLTRTGRRSHRWAKGVYAMGTQSQFILAWRSGWGPGSDVTYVLGLRRDVRRDGRYRGRRQAWVMIADAGFDGHTVRADDLVPPIRRGVKLVHPERRARADLVAQARLDGVFGQRWQSETVHSVIKRKFGDTLRSRKRSLQRREPIIKGLVSTIHRYLRLDVSESLQQSKT